MPAPSHTGGPPLYSPNRSANADYSRGPESYRCCRDTLTSRRTGCFLHQRGLGPVYLLLFIPSSLLPRFLPLFLAAAAKNLVRCDSESSLRTAQRLCGAAVYVENWSILRQSYLNCTHLGLVMEFLIN